LHLGQCSQIIQPGIGAFRDSSSFLARRSARFIILAGVLLIFDSEKYWTLEIKELKYYIQLLNNQS